MSQTVKKRGFTIIEVVLVLAIAGLIFMMVFLAFPALQRSQKDTQRRDQLSGLVTQIIKYQSNNRNQLPSDWDSFRNKYMLAGGDTFEDPNGEDYVLTVSKCEKKDNTTGACSKQAPDTFDEQEYKVLILTNSTCNGETAVYNSGSKRVSVLYTLEGGGVFCANN